MQAGAHPVTARVGGREARRGLRRLAHCIACGHLRTGLPRDAPCPECGTLPPPRHVRVLSEAPGLSVGDTVTLVAAIACGVVGVPALVRGLSSGMSAIGIAASIAAVLFGLSFARRWRRLAAPDHADRRHWVVAPAGITIVARRDVRFRPWHHISQVTVRRTRRGALKLWLAFAGRAADDATEELLVAAPRSLTTERLSRLIVATRARGLRARAQAPPTASTSAPEREVFDAVLPCPRCGRPARATDAVQPCQRCGATILPAGVLVLAGCGVSHPLVAEAVRTVVGPLALGTALAAALLAAGRVELACLFVVVLGWWWFRALGHLARVAASPRADRAWVLRDDCVEIVDRAFVRRVTGDVVEGLDARSARGRPRSLALHIRGEADVERLWLMRGTSCEAFVEAATAAIGRWRVTPRPDGAAGRPGDARRSCP